MDLSNLKPAEGSIKKAKRIGRGQGSGRGGTSTRGHKGQKSRSGYSRKKGFEGGQMPLQRRVPKFGFTNPNRVEYQAVNLGDIQKLSDAKKIKDSLDLSMMIDLGLAKKKECVKILSKGEYKIKLNITLLSLILISSFDLISFSKAYVNESNFTDSYFVENPYSLDETYKNIISDDSDFRVLDLTESSTRPNFYLNSINGYHASSFKRKLPIRYGINIF